MRTSRGSGLRGALSLGKLVPLVLIAVFLWNLWMIRSHLRVQTSVQHKHTYTFIASKWNESNSSGHLHDLVFEDVSLLPSCHNRSRADRPWVKSKNLPSYLKEYLDWHVEMRCALDQKPQHPEEDDVKYLVVLCLQEYHACGGLADRLLPLPIYILYAYKMKRLLLIRWTRPYPLEEFLVPFGINWTVPEWLIGCIPSYLNTKSATRFNNLAIKLNSTKIMTAGLQIGAKQLSEFYNTQILKDFNDTDYTYERVYRDLFHSMFVLVPPIESLVQNALQQFNLTPGAYSSVHVRARHHESGLLDGNGTIDKSGGLPFSGRTKGKLLNIIEHALSCAATSSPGLPIYIATDSHLATNHVILQNEATRNTFNNSSYEAAVTRIVGAIHHRDPLHLDEQHTQHHHSRKPSDYYHIFVDLWLLGMSKCSAVGVGGFGRLGLNLSSNSSCFIDYTIEQKCVVNEEAPFIF